MVAVPSLGHKQTYEPISSTVLNTTATDITFSNLPGTYTDIIATFSGFTSSALTGYDNIRMQLNGDTTTKYSSTNLYGTGSTASSQRFTTASSAPGGNAMFIGDIARTGTTLIKPSIVKIQFMSYASSNIYKTVIIECIGDSYIERIIGLWQSASPITSIKFFCTTDSFASGCSINLHGITAA